MVQSPTSTFSIRLVLPAEDWVLALEARLPSREAMEASRGSASARLPLRSGVHACVQNEGALCDAGQGTDSRRGATNWF